jgi:hypothetical protein
MRRSARRFLITLLVSTIAATAYGETLLVDEFDGPNLDAVWQPALPDAPWRFGAGVAIYQGPSSFTFEQLNGHSVIHLHNVLDDAQRRGWSSSKSFPTGSPIVYEARFNTLVQSAQTGIDELLEIWLLDANDPARYDFLSLTTPGFGVDRVFTSGSSITNTGLDTGFFFENNTWYRMIIRGSPTEEVRASIYDDAGTQELIGVGLGHTLAAYPSGFRVGFSQSMGLPGAPFPTDAAVDWLRLSAMPLNDDDGDGVADRRDECPASDLSATVAIRDCDSGVVNPVFPSGCTLADLTSVCERAAHRGRFARCVAFVTAGLKNARVITRQQKFAIQRCAVRKLSSSAKAE